MDKDQDTISSPTCKLQNALELIDRVYPDYETRFRIKDAIEFRYSSLMERGEQERAATFLKAEIQGLEAEKIRLEAEARAQQRARLKDRLLTGLLPISGALVQVLAAHFSNHT